MFNKLDKYIEEFYDGQRISGIMFDECIKPIFLWFIFFIGIPLGIVLTIYY